MKSINLVPIEVVITIILVIILGIIFLEGKLYNSRKSSKDDTIQLLQEIEEIKQLTNPTYRAYARLDNLTDLAHKERELMEAIARTILDDGLTMLR